MRDKTKFLMVRVSPSERQGWKTKAKQHKLNLSQWVRKAIAAYIDAAEGENKATIKTGG